MRDEIKLTKTEKEKISKAATDFSLLCQGMHLPFYLTVAVGNGDGKTEYMNKVSTAQSHGRHLADDQITRHMLVSNGFAVVPPAERVVFEDEDSTDTES